MADVGRKKRGRSGADELLALRLASGASVVDAAKAAGVSERTARRRLDDEDFAHRVDDLRSDIVDAAVGRLAAASTEAADKLRALMSSEQEYVRLAACREVLLGVLRLHLHPDLREAIKVLKQVRKRNPRLFADDGDDEGDCDVEADQDAGGDP